MAQSSSRSSNSPCSLKRAGFLLLLVVSLSNIAMLRRSYSSWLPPEESSLASILKPVAHVPSHTSESTSTATDETERNDQVTSPATNLPPVDEETGKLRTRTFPHDIDVSDPLLYDSITLYQPHTHGSSKDIHDSRKFYNTSTATVMGMASGYGLSVYQQFVGSLRRTGYDGHIILGVSPNVSPDITRYLRYRNVTYHKFRYVNCTYQVNSSVFEDKECAHPYPDIKTRWSRFPLQRDWLLDCPTCTGPVLIMDVRDALFQHNPFGPVANNGNHSGATSASSQSTIHDPSTTIKGLQVYEEHKNQSTLHWLTKWPIEACKNIVYDEIMLCSGTTIGTRPAMLKYLEIMYAEMKLWIANPKCWFGINGDDQSIHNYLYYSGQLPFATAMVNRGGGIVNTIGVEASIIAQEHLKNMFERYNKSQGDAWHMPYDGAVPGTNRWIGGDLINDRGFFTEFDGRESKVVHQWDRFGPPYSSLWLGKQDFIRDEVPEEFQ